MKTKKLIKALLGISFLTLGMVTVNDVKENTVVEAAETLIATYEFSNGATLPTGFTKSGTADKFATTKYALKANGAYVQNTNMGFPSNYSSIRAVVYGVSNGTSGGGTVTVNGVNSSGTIVNGAAATFTPHYASASNASAVENASNANPREVSFTTSGISGLRFTLTNRVHNFVLHKIEVYADADASGGEETPVPTLSIASSANYMDAVGSVTFTPTIENADQTTVTYTSSDPAVAAFEGNVLKAKSVGKVDVTASMVVDGETYTSNTVSVKVWPEENSELTIAEANGLSSLLEHNELTPYSYIVKGKITDIYNEEYGNAHITDEDSNEYTIFGMYDEDGNRYDVMTNKPVVNGTYSFEGKITNYNGTIETKNAVVTKVSVPAGAYFTTQAQLGFTYEYSKEESNVASGKYEMVSTSIGLADKEAFVTKTSSDGVVTITGDQGTHSNSVPRYYDNGSAIRVYVGNTITITSTVQISSIVVECASESYILPKTAADSGTYSVNGNVATIENPENTVVLTNTNSGTTQVRITKITVNYGGSSSSYEFTNFDNYQLRFFAEVQEVQVETLIKEGESIEDLTFGALITPKLYMENSGYASFEAAYAENPNVNFEEVFAAKNVTANYVDGQFGIILNNIPTTDVEVCVVLYAQATDGTMYFVEQKTVSVESVVTAYYNQINSLGLEEEQIEAVKALYAQVTAQA